MDPFPDFLLLYLHENYFRNKTKHNKLQSSLKNVHNVYLLPVHLIINFPIPSLNSFLDTKMSRRNRIKQFLLLWLFLAICVCNRMAFSQQIPPPSSYASLPLNQAASILAQPATAGLAQLPPGLAQFGAAGAAQTPNLASLGIGGLGVGGLNGLIGGGANQLQQIQTLQQLQALQGLGGLGIGLNGMGIPTNGATFIPLGQVLIPTGKEFTSKELCRNKGDNGGGGGGNNQQQNGFCPECGNFGCCPGQFCMPECPPPSCSSQNGGGSPYNPNQLLNQMNQMGGQQQMGMGGGMSGGMGGGCGQGCQQQQQFMMNNGGGGGYNQGAYNNGGGQRKRRMAIGFGHIQTDDDYQWGPKKTTDEDDGLPRQFTFGPNHSDAYRGGIDELWGPEKKKATDEDDGLPRQFTFGPNHSDAYGGGKRKRRSAISDEHRHKTTILTVHNKKGENEIRGMGMKQKGKEWTFFKYKVKST